MSKINTMYIHWHSLFCSNFQFLLDWLKPGVENNCFSPAWRNSQLSMLWTFHYETWDSGSRQPMVHFTLLQNRLVIPQSKVRNLMEEQCVKNLSKRSWRPVTTENKEVEPCAGRLLHTGDNAEKLSLQFVIYRSNVLPNRYSHFSS